MKTAILLASLSLTILWVCNHRHAGPVGSILIGISLLALLRLLAGPDTRRRPLYCEPPAASPTPAALASELQA